MANQIPEAVRAVQRLRRVIAEIETSGLSSASLTSGAGSKTYTRLDLNMLYERLHEWERRAAQQLGGSGYQYGGLGLIRPNFGRI